MNNFGKTALRKLGILSALGAILIVASCGSDDDGGGSKPMPVASFTTSVTGLSVTVTNTSEDADSYSWDFGDGSAALTIVDGVYTYAAAGTYTITLTASNDKGDDTATAEVTVIEEAPCDGEDSLEPGSIDYGWGDAAAAFDGAVFDGFGGYTTARIENPDQTGNETCFVMQVTRGTGCESWGGLGSPLGSTGRVDFGTQGGIITLDVWGAATDVTLVFEKDPYPDTQPNITRTVNMTKTDEWETLTFDFSDDASGNTYANLIIYVTRDQAGCADEVYYLDNLVQSSN